MSYCTKCGKSNIGNAKFCTSCGGVLKTAAPAEAAKNPPVPAERKTQNQWMIIAIVAIAGLLATCYFLFLNKKKEDKKISAENVQTKPLADSPITESDAEVRHTDTTMVPGPQDKPVTSATPGRFPEASDRYLTSDDLLNLDQAELKIMRNEIYARHGYIFQKDDMRQYFTSQSWYHPLYNNVDDQLTSLEKSNIYMIKEFEK